MSARFTTHQSTQSRTWAHTFSSPRSQWNCHSTQLQAEGSLALLPLIFLPVSKNPKSFYDMRCSNFIVKENHTQTPKADQFRHIPGTHHYYRFGDYCLLPLNPKPYTYFFETSFLYTTSTNAACHVKVEVESKTLNPTPVSLRYPSHTPV